MRISKYLKRIVSVAILISMLAVSLHSLGKAMTSPSYAHFYLRDVQLIKDRGEDVDMVFLGASRTLRSFVPSVFEEQMGLNNVLNAASTHQTIEGSYYLLKELLKDFNPKYVVVGLVVNGFKYNYSEQEMQRKLIVYDRLSGWNKVSFAFESFKGEELLYALYAYRFRNNLMNMEVISQRWDNLNSGRYSPNKKASEYYLDKGFVYGNKSCETGNIALNTAGNFKGEQDMKPEKIKYLDMILDLCREKGIQVFLTSAPTTDMRLYSTGNYQDAVDMFNEYAENHGVVYHNLNYLMDRNEWLGDDMMFDYNHITGEAAYPVSEKYCEILNRVLNGEDTSDLLYANLDEYKKTVHRIVCVDAKITQNENDPKDISITLRSYQNDDVIPVYQIEVSYGNDEWSVLSEWSAEKTVQLKLNSEKCKIRVTASTGNSEDPVAYQVYELK